jgi:hypothetical protein
MSEHLERPNMNKPVFGDFVVLEMQRHRVANEYYIHEVLSQQFYSNYWRDVPIVSSQKETLHKTTEAVISVRSSSGLPIFNVRVCDILPMVGDKWCWKESPLRTRIAELEALVNVSEGLYERIYEQAARIAELEEKQRWIPVGERLPEDGEVVWLWDGKYIGMGYYLVFAGQFMDRDTPLRPIRPSHWMPLPESPNDTQTQAIVYGKESEE